MPEHLLFEFSLRILIAAQPVYRCRAVALAKQTVGCRSNGSRAAAGECYAVVTDGRFLRCRVDGEAVC